MAHPLELHLPSPRPCPVDVPTISSSSSCATAPRRPLTAARVDAVLRRTKSSLGHDRSLTMTVTPSGQVDDGVRGRPGSPIRANSRRRRSVASAPGDHGEYQVLRQGRTLSSARQSSTGAQDARRNTVPSRDASRASTQNRGISRQRSLSRGRMRRRATPHPDVARSQQRCSLHRQRNPSEKPEPERESSAKIKKFLKVSKTASNTNVQGSRHSTEMCPNTANPESSYVAKGTFLFHKTRERAEFHSPKASSQPEPDWRPGDGFSGDEAKPDFIFSMTGSRKRKRSRSLPGIGKLQVEAENVESGIQTSTTAIRPWTEHSMQQRMNPPSNGMKEIWPTVENFEDGSISPVPKRTEPESRKRARLTVSRTPMPDLVPKLVYQQAPLRNRGLLDFENFGRPPQDVQGNPQPKVQQLKEWRCKPDDEGNEDDERDGSERLYSEDEVIPETDYSYDTENECLDDQDQRTSSGGSPSRPRSANNEPSSPDDTGFYDSQGKSY